MKKRALWPYYLIAAVILLVPVAIVVTDALQQEVEVDFETIENAQRPGIQASQPDLAVVSEKEDTYSLQNSISSASVSQLIDLDYKGYFALVVYQGRKLTSGYNIIIQRITHEGNTVNVFVQFTERDSAKPAENIETSPYHLVKIPREGIKGELVFVILADGNEIVRQVYTLL